MCGLATVVDSGLFIVKKEVIDEFEGVKFNDINSELEYSLLLTESGHKCIFNPNIQSYVYGMDCTFKNPRLTKRFKLIKDNYKKLKGGNFAFTEQVLSLLNPNFWLIVLSYALLIFFSYSYPFVVKCNVVIFSAVVLACAFLLSLVNAKMTKGEIGLLFLHPLYSICHIIKNFPPVRYVVKKIFPDSEKDANKLSVDVMVLTKRGERACKLEFISTETGLARIRFIYKNRKYTTDAHLGMIYALRQLKSKMSDYGLKLKICGCCAKFSSKADGSTNMLKGFCKNEMPSPLLSEPQQTLIWNSCNYFEPASSNSFIEQLAQEVEEKENNK